MAERAAISFGWRAPFTSTELNRLHAEAFGGRVYTDSEWHWEALVAEHSLGWVVARHSDELVGFVNVISDGLVHAWLQDMMTAASFQRRGIGARLVEVAADGARTAGCEILHVDFDDELAPFYIDRCGFTPASAGLMQL